MNYLVELNDRQSTSIHVQVENGVFIDAYVVDEDFINIPFAKNGVSILKALMEVLSKDAVVFMITNTDEDESFEDETASII
jgi:hypothetical protein